MGLLDDAIREHLELKRRRGADAEEVTRQEQEALGAPQRAEFAGAAPAAAAGADAPRTPRSSDRARAPEPEPSPRPTRAEPEPRRRPTIRRSTRGDGRGHPARPARRGEDAPEDVAARRRRTASEDVLEETPEFLQETPEHDRLWFEQKPPRDFDLDR